MCGDHHITHPAFGRTMTDHAWLIRGARGSLAAALILALLLPPGAELDAQSAAAADALRVVTPDDYGEFENLGALVLSPQGTWLAATVGRVEGDGEVRLHRTDSDSVIVVERGVRAAFAETGLWAAVEVQPGEDERRRLQRAGDPVRNDLVLVDLEAGTLHERPEVAGWEFSPDGGYVFLRRYRPEGGDRRGADLVVRELATGVEVNLGNVAEAVWHDLEPALAMVIDAEGMVGNGVRTWHAPSETLRTLASAEARFSDLTWREDAGDLAVLRAVADEDQGDTLRAIVAWQGADGADPTTRVLEGEIPGGEGGPLRITDFRGLEWSDDGARIFFGAVPRDALLPPEEEEDPDAEEEDPDPRARGNGDRDTIPGLEIWHARDVDPIPQQRLRANQARRASEMVAWEVSSDRTVVLGGMDGDHNVSLLPGQETALLLDSRPYRQERMFGPVYRDVYRIDVGTGDQELLGERIEHFYGASPEGRYALFFEADQWHALELATGQVTDITSGLDGVFVNEEFDRTVPQKPPYGQGGWMAQDEAVLLYDRYDVWKVTPDGSGERLTRGAEDAIRHRVVRLDPDQDAFPADDPLYLSLYGEWTKRSGYGRLHPDGRVEELIFEDRSIGRLARATDADRFIFVVQRYDLPADAHVTDGSFNGALQVTRVNDGVLDRFQWGRSVLVDYENDWGERLQGALFYPADFEPGREYPMIVYPYERRSQTLHSWMNPSERSAYNTTVFAQNGYFVLAPDIVYRDRNPGLSFMEAILPAVDAALAAAPIDPERVGLTGHSWGGYQTTFAVTQTNRFAAAVAGAPLTNLMSMYLSFYWNTGGTDARIFEISQGRMEVPWWEDFESYRANSPVHHIEAMQTPLLMAFGTEDGAVEFNQGVEFYNAARRAGKDFVLLVYEGENHSLQQRPNQIDYHRRALEWFNHYLKGHEAPAWITEGASFLDQEEKLKRGPAAGRVVGAGQDGGG
jgi:dienelactone hydrolase